MVELDRRAELTPGSKYFYWELRGVPIRVEIGPRDMKQGQATIVRRDTLEKQTCKTTELVHEVKKIIKTMMDDMRQKAWQWMNEHVYRVNNLEEAENLLKKRAGVVEVAWCGRDECGHKLEEKLEASVLGIPADSKEKAKGNCVVCGKKAENVLRTAISY
jgi:prolyl-tRNA synthetase